MIGVTGPTFTWWLAATALPGAGTAMVYPTLLAAVGDVAHPLWRARAVGVYRLWRDSGYAAGAIVGGITADLWGLRAAIWAAAAITVACGPRCGNCACTKPTQSPTDPRASGRSFRPEAAWGATVFVARIVDAERPRLGTMSLTWAFTGGAAGNRTLGNEQERRSHEHDGGGEAMDSQGD